MEDNLLGSTSLKPNQKNAARGAHRVSIKLHSGEVKTKANSQNGTFVPKWGTAPVQSVQEKTSRRATNQLSVINEVPSGLDTCLAEVIKFQEYFSHIASIKIATLIGLKHKFATSSSSPESYLHELNIRLKNFPRSYESYNRHMSRLQSVGHTHPDAMILALLCLLPKSSGLPRQLSGYHPDESMTTWLMRICSSVSFNKISTKVRQGIPERNEAMLEVLSHLVELAVADAIHAIVSENKEVGRLTVEWVLKASSYMLCKHPAWCSADSWRNQLQLTMNLDPKIYSGQANVEASRSFKPKNVQFGFIRMLNFEQWSSIIGLISGIDLSLVVNHMTDLARRTSHDPLSVVFLGGCRYLRWSMDSSKLLGELKVFIRFIVSQLDLHRDISERLMHISALHNVLKFLDFSAAYDKQELMTIFQTEIQQIYSMCVRWANQEELKYSTYVLLADIFARCPSSFLIKSHNFISKRLFSMSNAERAKRAIDSLLNLLRGNYKPQTTGWVPISGRPGTHNAFERWVLDYGKAFQHVARMEETREARIGRVSQIWDAIYFRSHEDGGLKLELSILDNIVALLLQSTAQAFDHMTNTVLPAMIGHGKRHSNAKDRMEWKLAALVAYRCIVDPRSGFANYASKSVAADQDQSHNNISFWESLGQFKAKAATYITELSQKSIPRIDQSFDSERLSSITSNVYILQDGNCHVIDEGYDIGFEILEAASLAKSCHDEVHLLSESLEEFMKAVEEKSLSERFTMHSLKLYNLLRLDLPSILSQKSTSYSQVLKCQSSIRYDHGLMSTLTQFRLELLYLQAHLDPDATCGISGSSKNLLGAMIAQDEPYQERSASLIVQELALKNPLCIPELLSTICTHTQQNFLYSPGKSAFCLLHASFLLDMWVDKLTSTDGLEVPILAQSYSTVKVVEAWAICCLCSTHPIVRISAYTTLKKVSILLDTQEAYALFENGSSKLNSDMSVAYYKSFLSIFKDIKEESIVDRAFYRAYTDYASLKQVQNPTFQMDKNNLQPTIVKLVRSRHDGTCWPVKNKNSKPNGQRLSLSKSEIWLNVLLELADILLERDHFKAIAQQIWPILSKCVRQIKGVAQVMQYRGHENTFITFLSFYFAMASLYILPKQNNSTIAVHQKNAVISVKHLSRPSSWNAYVEEREGLPSSSNLKNVGLSPIDNTHIEMAIQKWNDMSKYADLGGPTSKDTSDRDENLDEILDWMQQKLSKVETKFVQSFAATDVRHSISDFLSTRAVFSSLLLDDIELKSAIMKVLKSAHWSSATLVMQSMVVWFDRESVISQISSISEVMTYLLSSHNVYLSIQSSSKAIESIFACIFTIEDDLLPFKEENGKQDSFDFAKIAKCKYDIIVQHASMICFISNYLKRLFKNAEEFWPERRRKHSLKLLVKVYETLSSTKRTGQGIDEGDEVHDLVGAAILEIISFNADTDTSKELEGVLQVKGNWSLTLRLFSDTKESISTLNSFVRSQIIEGGTEQDFQALYQFVFLYPLQANLHKSVSSLDLHSIRQIVENGPSIAIFCAKHLLRNTAVVDISPARMLILTAIVSHTLYGYDPSDLESTATLAMLHHVLQAQWDQNQIMDSVDILRKVAHMSVSISVEVIAECCYLINTLLDKDKDVMWIIKTLSFWCEAVDTNVLNLAELRINAKGAGSASITSIAVLSELCSITVKVVNITDAMQSMYLSGIISVWESLCSDYGSKHESNLIEIVTFLMQEAVENLLPRHLLRKILDALTRSSQDRMMKVLCKLFSRPLQFNSIGRDKSGDRNGVNSEHIDAALSIAGLSCITMCDVVNRMESSASIPDYARLLVNCLLHIDNSENTLLRNGSRLLMVALITRQKRTIGKELDISSRGGSLKDIDSILKKCSALSNDKHGRVLEWSQGSEISFQNVQLRTLLNSLTVYLQPSSPHFEQELLTVTEEIAFNAQNMIISGKAFEILSCFKPVQGLNVDAHQKILNLMSKQLTTHGKQWIALQSEKIGVMNAHDNMTSKSLYQIGQILKFVDSRVLHLKKNALDTSEEFLSHFWIAVAFLRCRIMPLYSHCLVILSNIFSHDGDMYLSSLASDKASGFWKYCSDWSPPMEGLGPILFWGICSRNYSLQAQSLQLFTHAAALSEQEIFCDTRSMDEGNFIGTNTFRITLSLLWIYTTMKDLNAKRLALMNSRENPKSFLQLEVVKVKAIIDIHSNPQQFTELKDMLSLAASGTFNQEPMRFLSSCVRIISTSVNRADLNEFGDVLALLACKMHSPLKVAVLHMIKILLGIPQMSEELIHCFLPLANEGPEKDPDCENIKSSIVTEISRSRAFEVLSDQSKRQNWVYYDGILVADPVYYLKASLSAATQVSARVEQASGESVDNSSPAQSLLALESMQKLAARIDDLPIERKAPLQKATKELLQIENNKTRVKQRRKPMRKTPRVKPAQNLLMPDKSIVGDDTSDVLQVQSDFLKERSFTPATKKQSIAKERHSISISDDERPVTKVTMRKKRSPPSQPPPFRIPLSMQSRSTAVVKGSSLAESSDDDYDSGSSEYSYYSDYSDYSNFSSYSELSDYSDYSNYSEYSEEEEQEGDIGKASNLSDYSSSYSTSTTAQLSYSSDD